jgi:hypothetical protein
LPLAIFIPVECSTRSRFLSQRLIEALLAKFGPSQFAKSYLAARDLQWAANLISTFEHVRDA